MVSSRWFERRPCFWLALAAAGAVWVAYELSVPPAVWLALAIGGGAAVFLGLRRVGALMAVASVYGLMAGQALAPSPDQLKPGEPVTLRGVVEHARPAGAESTRIVVRASARQCDGGWLADSARYGTLVPGTVKPGDRVELSGRIEIPLPATNPGDFDSRLSWLRYGVCRLVDLRPGGFRLLGQEPRSPWRTLAASLRARVLEANRRTLSPEAAVIANNFLVGDDAGADLAATKRVHGAFRESGTLHLLVVSGTQVGMVAWLFLWLGWRFQRVRAPLWLLGVGALALFHAMTEGDPSVSRAAVMGAAAVGGLLAVRKPDGENCLGLSALVLLAMNPFALLDVGAQLSFAAVWALMRVAPPLARLLGPPHREGSVPSGNLVHGYWSFGAVTAAACVAAHLATAPILAYHFQSSSWSAVAANCCIALLAAGFMAVLVPHVLLASLGLPILAPLAEFGASSLLGWAGFFAEPPLGARAVFPPPLWLLPVCFGALWLAGRPNEKPLPILGGLGALVGMLVISEKLPALPPAAPVVRAIDIGQGDALLLQGRDGRSLLCDAGPPGSSRSLVRTLRALRVGRPDALLISHTDADHVGGLQRLCAELPPRLLIHSAQTEDAEGWAEVAKTAVNHGIPLLAAEAGDRIRIGASTLTILGPLSPGGTSDNEASLVARWDSSGARVLLTGDIGRETERGLLTWGPEVRSDVLKVAHHGSAGSTDSALLEAVAPRCAVISCGRENRYGHPSPDALARLQVARVPVARTDQGGMVTIYLEKNGPRVETHLGGSVRE